ncbi:glycosyl hydrolase 6-domain-containing protein [Aspergillus keveii]|uniref:Glycosyl hydrolase 6-domain-containing protein n=1 Tax=Aspergillus keveii TaxID=714993 RepID=A0ABR4FPZ8_9EURO
MTIPNRHPKKWWHDPFSVVQTNLREIDAGMDVEAVADWVKDHGASAWLCGVGGIQTHYPTKLTFQSTNPYLAERASRDLVGDAIAAAHARGLKFLARMDFSKIAPDVAAEHPEWCYLSPEGRLQEHTAGLVSVCPSGDYYQERIFDILEEVTSRYKIDGMFFNWATMNEEDYFKVYHGWLAFAGEGTPLPKGPESSSYGQWLVFSRQIIDDITARIRSFISQKLPDAALIRGKTADIIYQESNNEIGREFWPHSTSEWVSSWIAYRPDVPVLANSTCFIDMRYRMAGEEPAQFAQYFIQCLSRGGTPSTYMMGTPGKIPYPCLPIARGITQFHTKWRDVYRNFIPCAITGLVRPDRGHMGSKEYTESLSEFRGIYTALQEKHIPFDIIAMDHLSGIPANGSLDRYRNLILPNLGRLPREAVTVFDSWVKRVNGALIATGSISCDPESGLIDLQSLPVRKRLADVPEGRNIWSSYVAHAQKRGVHYYEGPIIPLVGAAYEYDWKDHPVTEYQVLPHAPFAPPEKAYGNLQTDQPGVGVLDHGLHGSSGKGVVIAFTVGRGYYETGLTCCRDLFVSVFERIAVKESLVFDIAEQIAVTVHRTSPSTVVVHLVNMSGVRKVNFGAHVQLPGGSIRINGAHDGIFAKALRADQKLRVEDGVISLPTLDLFEVIVIEGLPSKNKGL